MTALIFLKDHYKISLPLKRKENTVRDFFDDILNCCS